MRVRNFKTYDNDKAFSTHVRIDIFITCEKNLVTCEEIQKLVKEILTHVTKIKLCRM